MHMSVRRDALHDLCGAIKRAVKAREYVVSEERVGRNVLVRAAETFSAEPWREEWWKTAESVTDALAHAKSVSGRSSRCAMMTTCVDDCDLDAASHVHEVADVEGAKLSTQRHSQLFMDSAVPLEYVIPKVFSTNTNHDIALFIQEIGCFVDTGSGAAIHVRVVRNDA